jgi:hypothetical protein
MTMPNEVAQAPAPEPPDGPRQGLRAASRTSSGSRAKERPEPDPVVSIHDPRAFQILATEHSSLLSTRALAYNESFTRGGMFLTFLSLSFVALALVAQAIPVDRDFLIVAAIVLAFDLVVGLTTFGRIVATSHEDYLAVQGMARIRHGYGEIAPVVLPYFTTGIHDDLTGVMVSYGSPPTKGTGAILYQLTTSAGMINLIVSMVGAVLALVVALILGASAPAAFGVAAVTVIVVFVALGAAMIRYYFRVQASIQVVYPTPEHDIGQASDSLS